MKRLQAVLCICCVSLSIVRGQICEPSWLTGAYDFFDQKLAESDCKRDLKYAYEGFMSHELWAYEMVDAWAKPQTGILTGHIMHIGNFDECLAIDIKHNDTRIRGKYCGALIVPNDQDLVQFFTNILQGSKISNDEIPPAEVSDVNRVKTSWGICVPASCTLNDLTDIWNTTREYFRLDIDVFLDDKYCDYERKNSLSSGALFTIIFLAVIGVVIIFCTIYDIVIYQRRQKKEPNPIVAFSAYTNGGKILSTETSDDHLQCLNGLRVISMLWIVLGHRYTVASDVPHLDVNILAKAKSEVHNMVFFGSTFAVDTFFVISGFLICYLHLQKQEKSTKFNIPLFYVHRLLRLTPSLAMIVLVCSTLILYLGNGPFWFFVNDTYQTVCEENWWATLLYVQNYVYPLNLCLPHAWYLAVDTQLYILSPLILIPLTKWPKTTISALVGLILASMAWVFAQTYILKLGPVVFETSPESSKLSSGTHARASPWLIGFIFAYVMYKLRNSTIKMNQALVYFMWISTVSGLLAITFGLAAFVEGKRSVIESALYNTLSRPCWSLSLCWIIFACTKNLGGIVNKILSLPVFNTLIKINYNMYLLHFVPMVYFAGQGRISTHTYVMYEYYQFWADVMATIILAFLWTIAFEMPVTVLEKIALNNDVSKSDQKNGKHPPPTRRKLHCKKLI